MFAVETLLRLGAKCISLSKPVISSIEDFNRDVAFQSDTPIPWEKFREEAESVEREFGMKQIREQRNKLLAESDWYILPDTNIANKEAWKEYRQALRDLTSLNFPVVWLSVVSVDMSQVPWPIPPPTIRSSVSN